MATNKRNKTREWEEMENLDTEENVEEDEDFELGGTAGEWEDLDEEETETL
jgi:hypothetical protein